MAPIVVAVLAERGPGERRVALDPETVGKLVAEGYEVLVESGAGSGAFFPDELYAAAGASLTAGRSRSSPPRVCDR